MKTREAQDGRNFDRKRRIMIGVFITVEECMEEI